MMLNFTEHIKRIIQLAEQSLVHAQAGEFDSACEDIFNISISANESMQQLDDMSLMAAQGITGASSSSADQGESPVAPQG